MVVRKRTPLWWMAALVCLTQAPRVACGANYLPRQVVDAAPLGPVDGNEVLHLHAVLPRENAAEHGRMLLAMRQASTPELMTPAAYRRRFHPSKTTVSKAIEAMARYGLVLDGTPNGLLVPVRATARQLQAMLGTSMQRYRAADGRLFTAPSSEPKLPQGLPVESFSGLVQGLQQYRSRMRQGATPSSEHKSTAMSRAAQAAAPPLVNATTLRRAYGVPDTARGKGQTVGVMVVSAVDPADLQLYASANGLPVPPVKYVVLPGTSTQIAENYGEFALDMEMISAMAPDLTELRAYLLPDDFFVALNEVANPSLADKKIVHTISCSLGIPEVSPQDMANWEKVLEQMSAQGQTLFVASGDQGSFDNVPADMPTASPSVCAVGGTTLAADAQGNYLGEQGWSGSGGGITSDFSRPNYQAVLAGNDAPGAKLARNLPDVALTADSIQFAYQGKLGTVGGTSCAAPLWAGVLALVQEARSLRGAGPMGFVNTTLYAMPSADYAKTFHDVDQGSNGTYQAHSGYDLVTGWGSPNVGALLQIWGGTADAGGPSTAGGASQGTSRSPFVLPPGLRR